VGTGVSGSKGREANTHSWWSLEDCLELSHTFVGTVDAECTFYFGCCVGGEKGVPSKRRLYRQRKKKGGKGGLTHHSPLKTNHYSKSRDNSSSAHSLFSREKEKEEEMERQGRMKKKEGRKDRTRTRTHHLATTTGM